MYELEHLSIQENESLVSIKGMENLPKLKRLVLKGSKIEKLDDIPQLPCLEELHLDANAIASLDEIAKIKHL
jgi:Leucine-rich repeat (LRR) protein